MSEVAIAPEELYTHLRSHAFLRNLSDEELGSLCSLAKLVQFPSGTVIFSECDPAAHCYLIISGSVLLEICGPDGCTTILTVGQGDLLGWSAMLGNSRLTATARCQTPTQAIELSGNDVTALCEADPALGYRLMKSVAQTLSGRLTATRLQLLDLFGS